MKIEKLAQQVLIYSFQLLVRFTLMKFTASFLLLASTMAYSAIAQADRLEDIQKQGYITVGTTGDYKPFSYYDGSTFSGYDIDVAKYFATEMGVEVKFVQTTWKDLLKGLDDDKYDIAMGGITFVEFLAKWQRNKAKAT